MFEIIDTLSGDTIARSRTRPAAVRRALAFARYSAPSDPSAPVYIVRGGTDAARVYVYAQSSGIAPEVVR